MGDEVQLPEKVTAKMSNGSTKEVRVTWEPSVIDTSTAGTFTTVGTVQGYSGTVTFTVVIEEVEKGNAHISLFKDSTSPSNKIDFDNLVHFYLKNKRTGKEYSTGSSPWNNKNSFEMKDLPEGEYTIHMELPDGMTVKEIELGETYKETIYDPKTNPLVIDSKMKSYAKLVIKAQNTLAEINPLDDLSVPTAITYNEFKEALPKQTTIVDTNGREHQIDLDWDVRPFQFESYKKPGRITLSSEFFELPLSVSNTDPATRLEVKLNVNFEEEKIVSLETPETLTVQVGDKVELPATLTAKMSNETTKEVPVNWKPGTIDTSTPGTRTAVGTVEGYSGTVTLTVVVEAVNTGIAHVSLFKDSTSASNKLDFENITNFHLVNKKTGKKYTIGSTPWNLKNVYKMNNIPVGEYTIHFDLPSGMGMENILLLKSNKEIEYDAEANPFIIVKDQSNYAKIVLKSELFLKEIKPLEDLTVPVGIALDEFKEALPKQTTIVDSTGQEHQVDVSWDIRPFVFENWKKPGEYTLTSEFFKLPTSLSNTDPATRLEVKLKVKFAD